MRMYGQFISSVQGVWAFLYIISVIYASYIEVKKIQEAVLDGYDLVVWPADSNESLNVFLQLKIQKLVKLVCFFLLCYWVLQMHVDVMVIWHIILEEKVVII